MKIISKFKDYYDGISHQHLDKEVLYLREQKIVSPQEADVPDLRINTIDEKTGRLINRKAEWTISLEVIGFCGRFYPLTVLKNVLGPKPTIHCIAYSLDELLKACAERRITVPEGERWNRRRRGNSYWHYVKEYRDFFEIEKKGERLMDLFFKYNTPCFVVRPEPIKQWSSKAVIEINPALQNYEFARIVDPYSAHQEIYMFISGVLQQQEKPMAEISDKDKAHKHGFDKWSFRRPPKKK